MALAPDTRLGAYVIVGPIGAGGMGEVYRARDLKLDREVALKVLHDAFSSDPDRLMRFEREAKTLAALNHPNIAQVFGVEDSTETNALVMELVEGPTLEDVIPSGAHARGVPIGEALPIARQIADALEAAHDAGIIHRDLKPANIKIRSDGTVKVLDFGLAKAIIGDPATTAGPMNSPTLTARATQMGIILGTAAYMAPEQAKAKPTDRRADIWAFGCVLYEMLSGRRAFEGETVTDVLAAIIMKDPDWSALPESTPPAIRRLVRRCLQKDPRARLQAIGEARIAIEGAIGGETSAGAGPDEPPDGRPETVAGAVRGLTVRSGVPWALTALLALGLVAALAPWRPGSSERDALPVQAYIPPPPNTTFRSFGFGAGPVVVSPNGRQLAFSATDESGVTMLYVRPLASDSATAVPGTQDAGSPFWSADSSAIGFLADRKLKTVSLANGNVQVLADVSQTTCVEGGAWNAGGTILFAPLGCYGPLDRISAAGGQPTAATVLESGEAGHKSPAFLPDGRHFLYVAAPTDGPPAVWMASLDSSDRTLVLKDAASPQFAAGHLVFVRNGNHVFAQPMDPETGALSGEATAVVDARSYSASDTGVLAYQGGSIEGRLQWFDRSGALVGQVGPTAVHNAVRISPDGTRILTEVGDYASRVTDLWSYPAAGGVGSRLTFGPNRKEFGVWSPDGRFIAYSCGATNSAICRRPANGAGTEERLASLDGVKDIVVLDWSPDGRYLSFNGKVADPPHTEITILSLEGDRQPFQITQRGTDEFDGRFSPDGRWFAYFSYESGRPEVYVIPFPGPGGKFQISQNGGYNVQWDRNGHLYYLTMGNRLMEADLRTSGASLQVTAIRPLFQASLPGFAAPFFDVTADGSRFLVVSSADPHAAGSIGVLLNWEKKLGGVE